MVQYLLKLNQSLAKVTDEYKTTPLHLAVKLNNKHICLTLLRDGLPSGNEANGVVDMLQARDCKGLRPFDYIENYNLELLYYLEYKGLCVHLVNDGVEKD